MKRLRSDSPSTPPSAGNQLDHNVSLPPLGGHTSWRTAISNVSNVLEEMDAALERDRRSHADAVQSYFANDYVVQQIREFGGDIIYFNVGGVAHSINRKMLMKYPNSLLATMIEEASSGTSVELDEEGRILIDRDGEMFRHVLNYLRGYKPQLSTEEAEMLLIDLQYYGLDDLHDALSRQITPHGCIFQYGGGTTLERTRFRSSYCVCLVGSHYFMQGKHTITFEVKQSEYVGIGVVSDSCACLDQEFHKTANCCVYYMTGVFYSNFPHHKKEEGLDKFGRDDHVTVVLDMDDKVISFLKGDRVVRIVQCSSATRLRFAVVMKQDSDVGIVPFQGDSSAMAASSTSPHNTGGLDSSMEMSTVDLGNT